MELPATGQVGQPLRGLSDADHGELLLLRAPYGLGQQSYALWQRIHARIQLAEAVLSLPASIGGGVRDGTRFHGSCPVPLNHEWTHAGLDWRDPVYRASRV